MYKAYEDREWTNVGSNSAKIISDILFKSPLAPNWNYDNSGVLNDSWGVQLDVYNGFLYEFSAILKYFELQPIISEADLVEDAKEEELDEFGEPVVQGSMPIPSRAEKLQ